jgi:hypothetical protein
MIEHLLRFINANNTFQFWRILDKDGNELFEYNNENIEEIIEEIQNDFESLENGNYTLRGSKTKYQGDKASKKLPFSIKPEISNIQNTKKMSLNTYSAEQVEKMVLEAELRGREKAKIDILESKFNDFVARYEKEQSELKQAISRKFDEIEGDNDNDFLSKATDQISKIAPSIPQIQESLKTFKL